MSLTALLIGGLIAGLIGTAASAATSVYNTDKNVDMNRENNAFNAEQAAIQRDFSATEAQKARDFEERMSNTAIQRQAADLKAAGFNANALIGGLSQASSPVSNSASGFAAQSSGFAGSHVNVDLSSLSYLASSAMKLEQYKQFVGKENVYDATKMMTNAKTAAKVSKLANKLPDKDLKDLIASSKAFESNNMIDDLSFLQ